MSQLSYIGSFQLDNLVHNRVPFLFLNLGVDITQKYSGEHLRHISAYNVQANLENALQEVLQKNLPTNYAIIVACEDGKLSEQVAYELEKNNFINTFVIKNGFRSVLEAENQ